MKLFEGKWNPLKWVKDLLLSDYVGGVLRHVITAVGSLLTAKGLGDASMINDWIELTANLVTSPEFIGGIIAIFTGAVASAQNKKTE